jgi:hypothetical protein
MGNPQASWDKTYTRFEGTFTLKGGVPQTASGSWAPVGRHGQAQRYQGEGHLKARIGRARWLSARSSQL